MYQMGRSYLFFSFPTLLLFLHALIMYYCSITLTSDGHGYLIDTSGLECG